MAEQITYRLAGDADINGINEFYNEVYKKNRTYEQFNWEFNTSPAGKAIYVIAELDGKVIGTQCAIPYYIINKNNEEVVSAKSEDTLVSPNHRGKNIFDNMYRLLIEECKKNKIEFIWGFTYADKPFRKVGFEIPYKSTMGNLVLRPVKARDYFYSLTATKNKSTYLKISGLSYFSYLKFWLFKLKGKNSLKFSTSEVVLNSQRFNYIKYVPLFGLKLDKKFLDYRINNNPYSSNYKSLSVYEGDVLKASLQYNITSENIGFIIQLYFDNKLSEKESIDFIRQAIFKTDLKNCSVVRFWGFTHNKQNKEEVDLLSNCAFVFLKRGISFVGLNLNKNKAVNFSDFVLSRMASQGTD